MTITRKSHAANHIEIFTDWDGYEKFLEAIGDGHTRVTYDRGRLELMTPSNRHERIKKCLGQVFERLLVVAGIDYLPGGSTTFKRQDLDRGLEPDECYWVAHAARMRKNESYDPLNDPPPDIAIEVEISTTIIKRLPIYHAMAVPEIWRWTRFGRVEIQIRDVAGNYAPQPHSRFLPWLLPEDIVELVHIVDTQGPLALDPAIHKFVAKKLHGK